MKNNWIASITAAAAFAIMGAFVPPVSADEQNISNHSQGEIRGACNAAGGTLLGVSDSGSYGCELASKGTMILCNKAGNCTGYTTAQTKADGNKVLNSLKLSPQGATNKSAAK